MAEDPGTGTGCPETVRRALLRRAGEPDRPPDGTGACNQEGTLEAALRINFFVK